MPAGSLTFTPLPRGTDLASGLVLRTRTNSVDSYHRITHVFTANVYVMRIGPASSVRAARRPKRMPLYEVVKRLKQKEWTLGRVSLPIAFTADVQPGSTDDITVRAMLEVLEPLIEQFKSEQAFARTRFTRLISARANEVGWNALVLRRLLLRWWWFAGVNRCLLPIQPGPVAGATRSINRRRNDEAPSRRPGQRSLLEVERGPNQFITTPEDVEDMLAAAMRVCKRAWGDNPDGGVATIRGCHEEWLAHDFKKRNPRIYALWQRQQHVLPLSYFQYRRYLLEAADLQNEVFKALGLHQRQRSSGGLVCAGPGDVYELDPTGGQIVLLPAFYGSTSWRSYRPVIYLVIDRDSRFVVGVYVSLRPCSWEVLRITLRMSFTSRSRLNGVGMSISDEEWPRGVVPASVCIDRGQEVIGEQMLNAAVDGLRIKATILPPQTPDGKGIVERIIGVLKAAMKRDPRLKGQYKKFLTSPRDRSTKKNAARVAIATLDVLYRAVLEAILDHNSRPHSTLKKRTLLRKHGIPPTPKEAYKFGLSHVTGIQRPPLSDEDYDRLTLSSATATLRSDGSLGLRGRSYLPSTEASSSFARGRLRKSTRERGEHIEVKVDAISPYELHVPNNAGWLTWKIDKVGARDLLSTTWEEECVLAEEYRLNEARYDDAHRRQTVSKGAARPRAERQPSKKVENLQRRHESDRLARAVSGSSTAESTDSDSAETTHHAPRDQVELLEAQQRVRIVEENKRRRGDAH